MPGIDHQRFTALIEPHLEVLFRAAFRLTRNRADAEDLVQETCVRGCERLDALRGAGPAKSWLLRVMHNLFVDGTRRSKSSPISPLDDSAGIESTVSPDPTPDESFETRQRMVQLERAWLQLEPGHRVLLALRAEGHSLAEISEITGIAMDALTMRLYRARKSLARCVAAGQAPSSPTFLEAVK